MKVRQSGYLIQAASYLACAAVSWTRSFDLLAQEFGGGVITGPITKLNIAGSGVLAAAAVIAFFRPRPSAVGAIIGSSLCLPLYLYFATPATFRLIFPGNYSVAAQAIAPDVWAMSGVASVLAVIVLSLWNLRQKPKA